MVWKEPEAFEVSYFPSLELLFSAILIYQASVLPSAFPNRLSSPTASIASPAHVLLVSVAILLSFQPAQ